jgi:hypothetical protein
MSSTKSVFSMTRFRFGLEWGVCRHRAWTRRRGSGGTGVPTSEKKGMVVRKRGVLPPLRHVARQAFRPLVVEHVNVHLIIVCHYHLPHKNWNLYAQNKCLWKFASEISIILYDYFIDRNFLLSSRKGNFMRDNKIGANKFCMRAKQLALTPKISLQLS